MKPPLYLHLYLAATTLFGWLYRPLLWLRGRAGKEDHARKNERFGQAVLPRPKGPLVWIHGASVGESNLALALADLLQQQRPDISFLFTSGTRTSAEIMKKRLGKNQIHQYLPVDTPKATARFFAHWQPQLGILLEAEIWPALLVSAKRASVPLTLVNARMNERSRDNWQSRKKLAAYLFGQFRWVGAADVPTAQLIGHLREQTIPVSGNLKLLAKMPKPDANDLRSYNKLFGNRPLWLAASTHQGEEEIILQAHQKILQKHKNALLILVPRHPERGDEILALCRTSVLQACLRDEQPQPDTNVWIANSIGEMSLWLALSSVALIAGSLDGGFGHTPLEAITAGVPVVSGPNVDSFAQIYRQLEQQKAVIFAQNPQQIARAVMALIEQPATAKTQIKAAQNWMQEARANAADETSTALLSLVNGGSNAAS